MKKVLKFLKPTGFKLLFFVILILFNLFFGLAPTDPDFYLDPSWQQNLSKFFTPFFYWPFFVLGKYAGYDDFGWIEAILFEVIYTYILSCIIYHAILWFKNKLKTRGTN